MNPASNFACYRTMLKVATESKGGRVSAILLLDRTMFKGAVKSKGGRLRAILFLLRLWSGRLQDLHNGLLILNIILFFSLNSPFPSLACLSKMFIFLMRVTLTG